MTNNPAGLAEPKQLICPTAVPEHHLVSWRVDGFWLVLGRVGTDLLAYREICPDCGSSLVRSCVREGVVTCSICSHRYDLAHEGRSLDTGGPQLEPAPLMGEALAATA